MTGAGHTDTLPPAWKVWSALAVVYVVWGSTYVAIRVMVEDIPPALAASARFAMAGAAMLAVLGALRRRVRIGARELAATALIGLLLAAGGNGLVTVAERDVPAGLAALLIASMPMWLALLRATVGRERVAGVTIVGLAVGFAGVAVLMLPGGRPEEATTGGTLVVLLAAVLWASGSFLSPRLELPDDPLVSTAWQMVWGGLALAAGGLVAGEGPKLASAAFTTDALLALAYLTVVGSIVAYSAYAWLLQHAPLSQVATYAYVNPLVAVALGWALLSEDVGVPMLAGAALIVTAVAVIVARESPARGAGPAEASRPPQGARTASTARPASGSG